MRRRKMGKTLLETYTTGTGQLIKVHTKQDCVGPFCCIHNPSHHHMREWPTHWRTDRYLMERICPHGIGHPDPDHIAHLPQAVQDSESVHGCDGCCVQEVKEWLSR